MFSLVKISTKHSTLICETIWYVWALFLISSLNLLQVCILKCCLVYSHVPMSSLQLRKTSVSTRTLINVLTYTSWHWLQCQQRAFLGTYQWLTCDWLITFGIKQPCYPSVLSMDNVSNFTPSLGWDLLKCCRHVVYMSNYIKRAPGLGLSWVGSSQMFSHVV